MWGAETNQTYGCSALVLSAWFEKAGAQNPAGRGAGGGQLGGVWPWVAFASTIILG